MTASNAQHYARLRYEQFSLFEAYAKQYGLNNRSLTIFFVIYRNPQGVTQEKLARWSFSTKQVVQAIIKNHIATGCLYLESSKVDKRKKLVRMTEKGRAFISQVIEPLDTFEAQAMANLSAKQQEVLLEGTEIFSQQLKSLLESHGDQNDD